jgi:type I restriction-modification system DNA methylase subunit
MVPKSEPLFPELNTARFGDNHRKRPLFLPNYLTAESRDNRLKAKAQDNAHRVLLRWADLESQGKLQNQKETVLEAEFLIQVFADALRYTLFSEGKDEWNLKPKFHVNGGHADAAIGLFTSRKKSTPRAVIELKGPTVNVDRDKFNGRTPVQQCWDYLNALPECPWGIVSNFVSFRLYHRTQPPRVYELFTLQDLRKNDVFLRFYCLFERGGLLPTALGQLPRADMLLERSIRREREVGDELYEDYHQNRLRLIQHLSSPPHNRPLDKAIRIAQKLIDRIVFVAFCEDRGLLPERSLRQAWEQVPPFHRVTNPRWQNFLDLFRSIDEGNEARSISPYNGGLFRKDPEVDDLQLDDQWANFFKIIGDYDFHYEINVDVLGHLFEKSINDIERIRLGGLFESKLEDEIAPKMKKSAERKKGGIYYTPPDFTEFIANNTVAKLAREKIDAAAQRHGIDPDDIHARHTDGKLAQFALDAIDSLRRIKVVDPACGSGAFLIQAYDVLEEYYLDAVDPLSAHDPTQADKLRDDIPDFILHDNLFGVDLSPEAVEITQLALWLRSAHRGKTLADLSRNIICGNSLVTDPNVDPCAMDWQIPFPAVFSRDERGFDCVIGNPPWERIKLQEREFFDAVVPDIAAAVDAATRRRLIAGLKKTQPDLHHRYLAAKTSADNTLTHVRKCRRFPLTGKGDINTYSVFAELAHSIVAPNGKVGLLVPSGIASDKTNKDFFAKLVNEKALIGLYDFENRKGIFPDVHRSYKFCVLLFGGSQRKSASADFVFFAHQMEDLKDNSRHIPLSNEDIKLMNPNTHTCPVFRSRRDAKLTKAIYRRVPVLHDRTRKEGGNPWGIKFFTMFHQTNDAELFHAPEQLETARFKRAGSVWKKGKRTFLSLYEAKMVQMYDHRAASVTVKDANWMRQGQTDPASQVQHQNPEFCPEPRWWVDAAQVVNATGQIHQHGFIGFKDIPSPTNQRTMIA